MSEPMPLLAPFTPSKTDARLWNGTTFVNDPWSGLASRDLADDALLPAEGRVVVAYSRWLAERESLADRGEEFWISIPPGEPIDQDVGPFINVGVVGLTFPKFSDGRAYSQALRLRQEYGYGGEIRACGDVLLDQIPLMLRCGIDAFEITDVATMAALGGDHIPALARTYQTSVRGRRSYAGSRRSV